MKLIIERYSGNEERAVSADGIATGKCPGCGAEPFKIHTHPLEASEPGEKRAGGRCVACGDAVGWVYVLDGAETIFGKEEDDAMILHSRARVYGLDAPRG